VFWGPDTLKARIPAEEIVKPYNPELVGEANYTLSVGSQAYVTPTAQKVTAEDLAVKGLDDTAGIVIPSGQFGFILTHEVVKIPENAIAFISIRVRYKNRGLVNVSGFHVDPGWEGKLIFAVFNAGPTDIKIHHRDPYFHIWFAEIDGKVPRSSSSWGNQIESDLINNIGKPITSLKVLQDRVNELEKKQSLNRLILTGAIALLLPLAAGVGVGLALSYFGNWSIIKKPPPSSTHSITQDQMNKVNSSQYESKDITDSTVLPEKRNPESKPNK
jgi:dCTP deaminase